MDKMMNINGHVAWWPFLHQEARSGVNDRRAPFRERPTIVLPFAVTATGTLNERCVFHAGTHQNG